MPKGSGRGAWRWTDPETSRGSAMTVNTTAREYEVLKVLAGLQEPANATMVAEMIPNADGTVGRRRDWVQPRFRPLLDKGMIRIEGTLPGPYPTFKPCMAVVITIYGRMFLTNAQKVTPKNKRGGGDDPVDA